MNELLSVTFSRRKCDQVSRDMEWKTKDERRSVCVVRTHKHLHII